MRALTPILLLIALACDPAPATPPPAPPSPSPPPQVAVDAPAPPSPPLPTISMTQVCKDRLTPAWMESEEAALGALGRLSAVCGGGAFCEGEGGFVAIIARAQLARQPARACQGCHVAWRSRWRAEHAGARFAYPDATGAP